MTSFNKQLVLHKLPLPQVVIYIIKEFTFTDISVKIKRKINDIMLLIKSSLGVGRCQPDNNLRGGIFVFAINSFTNKKRKAHFGSLFCIKCGNYVIDKHVTNFRIKKIICNCNNLTY